MAFLFIKWYHEYSHANLLSLRFQVYLSGSLTKLKELEIEEKEKRIQIILDFVSHIHFFNHTV